MTLSITLLDVATTDANLTTYGGAVYGGSTYGSEASNTKDVDTGQLREIDFAKTHTGIGDFRAELSYDTGFEDNVPWEVRISEDGTLLFRGFLESVDNTQGGGKNRSVLSGVGIAKILKRDGTSQTFNNVYVHDAIDTVWDETDFNQTVVTPTATTTTTGTPGQSATTDSEFQSITSNTLTDDWPVLIQNDNIEPAQTAWTVEAESFDRSDNSLTNTADSTASNGSKIGFDSNARVYEWDFTVNHRIPAGHFEVQYRYDAAGSDTPTIEWDIDLGQTEEWQTLANESPGSGWDWSNLGDIASPIVDLEVPEGSHTIRAQVFSNSTTDTQYVDVVSPMDRGRHRVTSEERFDPNYTFTPSITGGARVAGPELFPEALKLEFNEFAVPWSVNVANITTSWDATKNKQAIEARLPGGTYFGASNTSNDTPTFGDEKGSGLQGRVTFGRYGDDDTRTPTLGFNSNILQEWDITFNGDDLAVYNSKTVEGSYFEVLQELHSDARMRWTMEHKKFEKPVRSYRPGDETRSEPDWKVLERTRTKDFTDYANHVTVRGQQVGGSRLSHTESDSGDIESFGQEHIDVTDAQLTSQSELEGRARQVLREKIQQGSITGSFEVAAIDLNPGYSYTVTWRDGTTDTIPMEEVRYQQGPGALTGTADFDLRVTELAPVIAQLKQGIRNTKRGF